MKENNKGSNAKRTPSKNRTTGESSTDNQRYKKVKLCPLFIFGNHIVVSCCENGIHKCDMAIPIHIWNDEKELIDLMNELKNSNYGT